MNDDNRIHTIKNMFVPQSVDDAMAEYLLAKCYEIINEANNPTDKPPRTEVTEILRKYFNLDLPQIEAIMDYALAKSQDYNKSNDYAVASELSERASKIFRLVADYARYGGMKRFDDNIKLVNRQYILLANELEEIYKRNSVLRNIAEENQTPIWRVFDVIEGKEYEISEFIHYHDNNEGLAHNAQIRKLMIVSGNEEPQYTKVQSSLIKETDITINLFIKEVERVLSNKGNNQDTATNGVYIPSYDIVFADDGSIVVNGVMTLKKTQSGSAPRKLMEQATKQPNVLFKPNLGAYNRRLTSVLSDMGIKGKLKSLFFPVISEENGVKFRPSVSRAIADQENIDTTELDMKLIKLNAHTELDLNNIPF